MTPARKVPHYLSRADIAELLGLASQRSLSRTPLPPPDVRIGGVHKGMVFEGWSQETVDKFIAARKNRGNWGARGSFARN